MGNMLLPVPHFHLAVAAALFLGLAAAGPGHARQDGGPLPHAMPVQDAPPQDDIPEDEGGPLEDEGEALPESPLSEPAAPSEPTAEARLREREDLDLLFAELAQPGGETWARAETDILRIWSRSGSAAMDLLYKRGEAALDTGDTVTAIGHLTALTDHAPDFAAGWYLRSVAFYLDGDFGPAIADLGQVLRLESRHFGALTQLGTILEELGDDRDALEAFRQSLKIHPHQQEAQDAVQRLERKLQGTDA
ncbi:tetratricopeptide repeat protein [Paracoccus versutus]